MVNPFGDVGGNWKSQSKKAEAKSGSTMFWGLELIPDELKDVVYS